MSRTAARPRPTAAPTTSRAAGRVPQYVYVKRSRSSGREIWYGDFRRYAAVDGCQEPLAQYLLPGEQLRTAVDATRVYWRAVGLYEEAVAAHRALEAEGVGTPGAAAAAGRSAAAAASPRDAAPAVARTAAPAPASSAPASSAPASSSRPVPDAGENAGADLRLAIAVEVHLEYKRGRVLLNKVRTSTVRSDGFCLAAIRRAFGDDCLLRDITAARLDAYVKAELEAGRAKRNTLRNRLHALSNMYRWLFRRGAYPFANPVAAADMPLHEDRVDAHLQLDEVARLLDAAAELDAETARANAAMATLREARRLCRRRGPRPAAAAALFAEVEAVYPASARAADAWHRRYPHYEALLATFFYTGGRIGEVLGLDVGDLDWHRDEVAFRLNRFRGLKRDRGAREVPIVPDLARVLRDYQRRTGITEGRLFRGRGPRGLGSLQSILKRCVERAKLGRAMSPHTCRHTYATALLRTRAEDRDDAPLHSAFLVAKRLGHQDSKLVDRVYGGARWHAPTLRALSFDGPRRLPTTRLERGAGQPAGGTAGADLADRAA